jgi:hypothetical protein
MVQHGDLWQSGEADCPPTSVEGVALTIRESALMFG